MERRIDTSVRKIRNFYDQKPDAPIYQKEFGYYVLERWISQGYLKPRTELRDYDAYLREVFGYDEPVVNSVGGLGWCEAGFFPAFEEKILEERGEYELVQDFAGRKVLCFKGRRNGFMPEYVDHPVKDRRTWEEDVKWRLEPHSPGRLEQTKHQVERAKKGAERGEVTVLQAVGGYMYLRSLMGPEQLLYQFYDDPDLIHECMRTWFELADNTIAHYQKSLCFDELFLAEDICYNCGALISPSMMKEFLLPYYQQLYKNMKRRNLDPSRALHFQIDTDGRCMDVIDLYRSVGCDSMSPFEVAAGCDVVAIGKKYPGLLLSGGIDKRMFSASKEVIAREVERIMPAMRRRGGYIPTCDHGVPEEASFENYLYFRELMKVYAN